MKGLLLKDLYVLVKQMRVFLFGVLIFAVIPGSNMTIFAVVYAAMMPYTALAYDERSHWDQLAGMMPYSIKDIVLSKYVLGWLFTAGAAALSIIASILESHFIPNAGSPLSGALAFCVGVITMAITLPPMFRFGVEKGRMIFILLVVVIACGSAGLLSETVQSPSSLAILPLLELALPVAAVVLSVASVWLSIRLYAKQHR